MTQDRAPATRAVLGRLVFREAGHRRWLSLRILLALAGKTLGIGFAFALRATIDATLGRDMSGFLGWALIMALLMLAQLPAEGLGRYAAGRYVAQVIRDLRIRTNRKLADLPIPFLNTHHSGDIVSRATSDLGQVAVFLENRLPDTLVMLASGAAALTVMMLWCWQVTLATFIAAPVFMLLALRAARPVERLTRERNEALGQAGAAVQDAVGGAAEIKAYSLHDEVAAAHHGAVDRAVRKGSEMARVSARAELSNLLAILIPIVVICATGVYMVLLGRLTIGSLMALIQLSNEVLAPLRSWGQTVSGWKEASGAARRVFELLDWPSERTDGEALAPRSGQPLISFEDVHFAYTRTQGAEAPARRPVFEGLSFQIREGETVAVVGPSGCGKSTLIHLIAGFYDADSGQIRFGGHELRRWNPAALRRQMALVQQETFLFPGTLGDNIACGARASAGEKEVERAARQARIHDFILSLPEGYQTAAGERGGRISGGQRQRVAMARAMIKDAPLLLLDEPTSALDAETEKELQDELAGLTRGRTCVIVAHRLSTIRKADRILVIDGGRIVEEGPHDRLMEQDGVYAGLVRRQLRAQRGEAVSDE